MRWQGWGGRRAHAESRGATASGHLECHQGMVGRKEEEGHHCVYAADVATQVPMLRGTLLLAAVTPATFAWWGLPATKAACPIRLDSGEIRLDLTIRGLFAPYPGTLTPEVPLRLAASLESTVRLRNPIKKIRFKNPN